MPGRYEAFFLVGPTATGKSAVAQYLAEQDGAEILSADSMLVYRGLDIGTAKPSRADRERVRYWGVDLVAPAEAFSVAQFLAVAGEAAHSTAQAGRRLIVVGGTGLYIKALLQGLAPLPETDPAARERWQALLREGGTPALQEALRARAPHWLTALADPNNGRRLVRALELVEAGLTEPPASFAAAAELPVVTGLLAGREVLESRIRGRVAAMYRDGLLDEVKRLIATSELTAWPTAAQALGYAEAVACLEGRLSEAEARDRTVIRTRQLAKRQMTWFRHQGRVQWVEVAGEASVAQTAERVRQAWAAVGPTPLVLAPAGDEAK